MVTKLKTKKQTYLILYVDYIPTISEGENEVAEIINFLIEFYPKENPDIS